MEGQAGRRPAYRRHLAVIIAITQIVLAVQTRKVAKTAHDALEGIWNRLTTALSD